MTSPMPAGVLLSRHIFDKYEDRFLGMVHVVDVVDLDEPAPAITADMVEFYFGDWEEVHVETQPKREWNPLLRDGWAWDDDYRQVVNRANCVRRHVQNLEHAGEHVAGTWDFAVFDKFIIADFPHSDEAFVIPMEMSADWQKLTHWDQLDALTK